jgi:intermediate filament protein if
MANRAPSVERGFRALPQHQVKPIAPAMKQQHAEEQQVLSGLNDRMKNYVERVLFLEETNKKLLSELDKMRNSWGQESKFIIEEMEPKLNEKREKIDELSKDAAKAGVKAKRLDYELNMMKGNLDDESNYAADDRDKIKNLKYILEQNIQEKKLLEERISEKEIDNKKHAKENARLNDELTAFLNDLDEENFKCLNLDNENQTLREQIKFLQDIHEQELKEMRHLCENTKKDPTSYYRSELETAIRDIRKDFEKLNEVEKGEIEAWYKIKSEEIRILSEKREPDELPGILATNRDLKGTLNKTNNELKDLEQDYRMLEKKLHDLEQLYDNLKRDNFYKLEDQDKQIAQLKKAIKDDLNDYDHLLHNKCDVELEINTLKRLLDSSNVPDAPKKAIPEGISRDDLFIRLEREKAKTGNFQLTNFLIHIFY